MLTVQDHAITSLDNSNGGFETPLPDPSSTVMSNRPDRTLDNETIWVFNLEETN